MPSPVVRATSPVEHEKWWDLDAYASERPGLGTPL